MDRIDEAVMKTAQMEMPMRLNDVKNQLNRIEKKLDAVLQKLEDE